VPKGKTYVLNAKGKEIARSTAGQVMAQDTVGLRDDPMPTNVPRQRRMLQCKARPEPAALGVVAPEPPLILDPVLKRVIGYTDTKKLQT
jgi:hypothetical protein